MHSHIKAIYECINNITAFKGESFISLSSGTLYDPSPVPDQLLTQVNVPEDHHPCILSLCQKTEHLFFHKRCLLLMYKFFIVFKLRLAKHLFYYNSSYAAIGFPKTLIRITYQTAFIPLTIWSILKDIFRYHVTEFCTLPNSNLKSHHKYRQDTFL